MPKVRGSFTDEFKREAVALLQTSGRPLMQIASELGIRPSMLRNRRNAVPGVPAGVSQRRNSQAVAPRAGTPDDQSAESARLHRENDRPRMERDTLKKQSPSSRSHRNEVPLHRGSPRHLAGARDVRRPARGRAPREPWPGRAVDASPGIRATTQRRFRVVTTDSNHSLPVAGNLLGQTFLATRPNQIWLADITSIPTDEGWLYLATVLDLFTRKVVGWAMRDHMRRERIIAAPTMAIQRRRPGPGLIHHSDRGSQYAAAGYRHVLDAADMVQSLSRKGKCWDNAPMESFFHTLKTELVHHAACPSREAAKRDLFAYIEGYYNRQRRQPESSVTLASLRSDT